jgi:hypothetical protein
MDSKVSAQGGELKKSRLILPRICPADRGSGMDCCFSLISDAVLNFLRILYPLSPALAASLLPLCLATGLWSVRISASIASERREKWQREGGMRRG